MVEEYSGFGKRNISEYDIPRGVRLDLRVHAEGDEGDQDPDLLPGAKPEKRKHQVRQATEESEIKKIVDDAVDSVERKIKSPQIKVPKGDEYRDARQDAVKDKSQAERNERTMEIKQNNYEDTHPTLRGVEEKMKNKIQSVLERRDRLAGMILKTAATIEGIASGFLEEIQRPQDKIDNEAYEKSDMDLIKEGTAREEYFDNYKGQEKAEKENDKIRKKYRNIVSKQMKRAGKILGPGMPDGTGPYGQTESCPLSGVQENEEEIAFEKGTVVQKKEDPEQKGRVVETAHEVDSDFVDWFGPQGEEKTRHDEIEKAK